MRTTVCIVITLSMLLSLLCGCSPGTSSLSNGTESSTNTEETKSKSDSTRKPTEKATNSTAEKEPESSRMEFDEHGRKISWSDVDPREAFDKLNIGIPYAEVCEVFGVEGTCWPTASGSLCYLWNFDFEGEWLEARLSFSRFSRDAFSSAEEWTSTPNLMAGGILYEVITNKQVDIINDWIQAPDIKVVKMDVIKEFLPKSYEYTDEDTINGIYDIFANLETTRASGDYKEDLSVAELLHKQIRFHYSNNTWQDFYLSSCGKYWTKRYFIEGKMFTNVTYYIGDAQAEMIYDAIYSLSTDEEHEYNPAGTTE